MIFEVVHDVQFMMKVIGTECPRSHEGKNNAKINLAYFKSASGSWPPI